MSEFDTMTPPTKLKLRMASQQSAGQIKNRAEAGNTDRETRRSEQAKRILRRRLGALASGVVVTLAIAAAPGTTVRQAVGEGGGVVGQGVEFVDSGIDAVGDRLDFATSTPDAARSESQLQQLQHHVKDQGITNNASKIDADN